MNEQNITEQAIGEVLTDAELEQVSAAGGRIDPGGANN